jgi:hypothetical protein
MTRTSVSAVSRKLQSVGFEKREVIGSLGFEIRRATFSNDILIVSAWDTAEIYAELVRFGYEVRITADATECHIYGKN